MSFDEFKGWLRGYLESDGGVDSDRILEELEKVDEVAAGPVHVPIQIQPPAPYRRPLGPWEVDPYRGRWFDYKIGVQPPTTLPHTEPPSPWSDTTTVPVTFKGQRSIVSSSSTKEIVLNIPISSDLCRWD